MMARISCLLLLLLVTRGLALGQEPAKTLSLPDALSMALAGNPALREAGARAGAASATAERARAPLAPQVRLDSRYAVTEETPSITLPPPIGRTLTLGEPHSWLTTVSASQVLYSGGRLQYGARQAALAAQAAQFGQHRARQLVVYQTTTAYYTLLAAQHEREVARQSLAAAEDHLRDAQARLDARAAPRFDVLRAEVSVEEARQEAVRAESSIAVAHAALLRALGLTAGQYVAADVPAPVVAELPNLDQLLATAQAARPELQAADRQVAAAEAGVRAARGERGPTVSLVGSYQLVSPETPFQLTGWTVAAVAGLPILDGGTARAKLREAQALLAQQQAARETLRTGIAADVRAAHARLTSAREQYGVAQKRLELADETRRIAEVRYREGIGTPTEVADAQAALTRARQGVTRALTEWQLATAELEFAVGGVQ